MITTVDLFSGCGGLSLGFQNAGFNIVAAFDNWDPALACYRSNFDHPAIKLDLSDIDTTTEQVDRYHPSLIIGGPPCQDFSQAGKRMEAERASLTESFAQVINRIRPRYFVMENVDRAQKSVAYARARKIYKDAGYGLTERVLLASRCHVPQRRKRFFCIGILGAPDGCLDGIIDQRLENREMTVRDYFGDQLDTEYYYRHPRNYSRRAIFSIDEPAPTMRGVNRPIPKGYPGHPGDACEVGPGVRPLTTLERSLIQTFPAGFVWSGSKTDQEQMIGNAVPVNLAKFVGDALLTYIERQEKGAECEVTERDIPEEFRTWLEEQGGLSGRVASDTVSRARRALAMQPARAGQSLREYLFELEGNDAFSKLSATVKSQIKGAVKKFDAYRQSRHAA